MMSSSTLRFPTTTLDDDAWDDLLSFIEERRVIPIVGPELLQVATDRGSRLPYDWLAAITNFDLFVSTTFDPLLENALNMERSGGAPSTDVLSYAPNRVADLPTEREHLQRPVVYHSAPAPMRALHSVRRWRDRIRSAG